MVLLGPVYPGAGRPAKCLAMEPPCFEMAKPPWLPPVYAAAPLPDHSAAAMLQVRHAVQARRRDGVRAGWR